MISIILEEDEIYRYIEDNDESQFFLWKDNWDDYNNRTLFRVIYFDKDENKEIKIGKIKIANLEEYPSKTYESLIHDGLNTFSQLSNEKYVSIGTDVNYYINLMELKDNIGLDFLNKVNDLAKKERLYSSFIDHKVVRVSLLRDISKITVSGQFRRVLENESQLTNYEFKYKYFSGIDKENKILDFKVEPNSLFPTNMHSIIGKNGTGKTNIFKEIIKTIKNVDNKNGEFLDVNGSSIIPENLFSRFIYINFSYFDDFDVDLYSQTNIFKFLGIANKKIIDDFNDSLFYCLNDNNKRRMLIESFEKLKINNDLIDENIIKFKINKQYTKKEISVKTHNFNLLSSGHKIILTIITKLVASIEEKTLILLEEPENHIYPILLSNFLSTISYIIRNRNVVALISTHSPLVIREIPKDCCYIINKFASSMSITRPSLQTYGASINTIMRESFDLISSKPSYFKYVDDLINSDKININNITDYLGDEAVSYYLLKEFSYNENN